MRRKQPAGHSTTSTQPGAEKKAAFGISRRYHENDAVVFK